MSDATPTLTDDQRRAVRIALTERLAIVTGGPGSGKTTTMRTVADELARRRRRILLLAPTGKAAARLAQQTGRPASTVHRAIGWTPAGRPLHDGNDPVDCDGAIVDESSMVDSLLLARLVAALPEHASLLLVGDDAQLPPVGPGAPFRDLLASGAVPAVRLSAIFRQGKGSPVADAARAILRGEAPADGRNDAGAFKWIAAPEHEVVGRVAKLVAESIPRAFGVTGDDAIQVLCPGREGDVSVASLNDRLLSIFNPRAAKRPARLCAGDKVINTKNDYEIGVFNGEIGRVLAAAHDAATVQFPDRVVPFDGRERVNALMRAWCLTVHRSQGSEYPVVVVALSERHRRLLSRRLLYTAVTRASLACIVVSSPRARDLALAERGDVARETSLGARLAALRGNP